MVERRAAGAEIASNILGTAFVVDADRGWIVTAGHVVGYLRPEFLSVRTTYNLDGQFALGTINTVMGIFNHPERDIAVLKIDDRGTRGRGLTLHASDPESGDPVAVFGFASGTDLVFCDEILGQGSPKSPTPVAFCGCVAARVPDDGRPVDLVVHDVRTFPANSGSPILALESGEVVALHLRSHDNRVGFACPISVCQSIVADLAEGRVKFRRLEPGRGEARLMSYLAFEKKVEKLFSDLRPLDGPVDVQGSLEVALGTEKPEDLLEWDWDAISVEDCVKRTRWIGRANPQKLADVHVPESVIPEGTVRKLCEVRLKSHGEVWEIHKNDADPFPSNPHAHNLESGLKLDLSTGDLFLHRKKTGRVTAKHLLQVRGLASKRGVALPAIAE